MLPKFTDPIQYQPPAKTSFLQSNHTWDALPSCNVQDSSMILTLCLEAFAPLIEDLVLEYHLPLPGKVLGLQLQTENLVCLILVPWDHLVRTGFSTALSYSEIDPQWGVPTLMKLIEHATPSHGVNYMDQFTELFAGALHLEDKSYLVDVFSGSAPYTTLPSRN